MGRPSMTLREMMGHVEFDTNGGCWLWAGSAGVHGYGKVGLNHKTARAHRAVYEAAVGPIPSGMVLDHLCNTKICVNPAHLEPVTVLENTRRAAARITHCPQGHPYDSANTCLRRNGARRCRACGRAYWHNRAYRNQEDWDDAVARGLDDYRPVSDEEIEAEKASKQARAA